MTYPLIGNYGVPDFHARDIYGIKSFFESEKIHIAGLIVSEYSHTYNHYEAVTSLADVLIEQKIPAISGIDTRALTLHIREHGCVPAKIIFEDHPDTLEFSDPNERKLAYEVCTREVVRYNSESENRKSKTLLVVDMGVKNNMIRHFLSL